MEHHRPTPDRGPDPAAVLAALDQARLAGLLWADPAVGWPSPNAIRLPWLRLNLVLVGERRFRVGRAGAVEEVRLAAGRAIVAPPFAQTELLATGRSRGLGLVLRPGYLRLIASEHGGGADGKRWLHTRRPLPPLGRHLAAALNELALAAGDRRLGIELVRGLLRIARELVTADPVPDPGAATERYRAVIAYLEDHHQQPVDRASAARALGMAPGSISRLLRQHGDDGFTRQLTRLRLEHARHLLEHTDQGVAEIATRSGFGDVGHFIRTFRRHYGTSPGRHRAVARGD